MTDIADRHTYHESKRGALEAAIRKRIGADAVSIADAERMSGGAVQENWRLAVTVDGGPFSGRNDWVLRTDARARLAVSLDRSGEYAVLEAAHAHGIRVAQPILEYPDASIIGAPFMIQRAMPGVAAARALVRDPALGDWGPALVEDLGRELARIHQIHPQSDAAARLGFLPRPMLPPARAEVHRLRGLLDTASEPRPALEYILNWLDTHAPVSHRHTLVHGDFRTGNLLIEDGQLSAVLDWEFAHWGDPAEDLGWFCARCWRFGNDHNEAGGLGPREAFVAGYRAVAGETYTASDLIYWEIMAAAKWAAIAVLQGDRYRRGGEDSLELVLTGLMPPEMELDALMQIETIETRLTS
ncbi:MAG: phosphotransferase family protein [Pseudomonadota bacterium]